ncbi:SGF29 tudor-like domain [Zostera marina]|uniref:SGF29 tudor-like domain n=1 Tax=Zostera marina TaxID=29655 RepID=A0A0K9NMK3_ZOSMR|nr:SGF29 tudor-like domain [Zostera marina]
MGTMNDTITESLEKAKELDQLRKDQEEIIVEINKIHKKLSINPDMIEKAGDGLLLKLRSLYAHAKELADTEVNTAEALLSLLDSLPVSGMSATQRRKIENEHKRRRLKCDSDIPRPPPASMRSHEQGAGLKGEQVAARVNDEEKAEWFVVKVINYDKDTKEYEVLDEDPGDDEESVQKKYKLPVSRIIPFPKRNDPSSIPDFPQGRNVLAVYPGTTALYKATVVNQRKRKLDDYLLEFEDDEENGAMPQRIVPFFRVVALPEGHRQ